jgi:hypothetical protein
VSLRGQPKISLFPFMSVLACTIGALTLLLVAMSLAAVGSEDVATFALAQTQRATRIDQQALALEERRLAGAERLWALVDEALVRRGLAPGLSQSSIDLEVDRARRRLVIRRALEDIEDQRESLATRRDSIETTIEVLESRRETLPILIDPTGLSRHFEPYFVECDAEGATAYSTRDDIQYFVAKDELSNSGNFGRYLRRVRAVPGALLVLLVRPDGISTAIRAHQVARDAEITVARLPLPGTGTLDFSLLRRAHGGRVDEGEKG